MFTALIMSCHDEVGHASKNSAHDDLPGYNSFFDLLCMWKH